MSGKTGWFCYAKKSGCDILDKKMKSKNVSLAVEIYPREGTETIVVCHSLERQVEIYPREGTETRLDRVISHRLLLKFIPVRGQELIQPNSSSSILLLKFIPVRGRKLIALLKNVHFLLLKFIPVRGRRCKNLVEKFNLSR